MPARGDHIAAADRAILHTQTCVHIRRRECTHSVIITITSWIGRLHGRAWVFGNCTRFNGMYLAPCTVYFTIKTCDTCGTACQMVFACISPIAAFREVQDEWETIQNALFERKFFSFERASECCAQVQLRN